MRCRLQAGDLVWVRPWTADELGKAIQLRREGKSSSRIARTLKRTRNSVVGALWRAGEPGQLRNQHSDTWLG